jgi:hypothetical protein
VVETRVTARVPVTIALVAPTIAMVTIVGTTVIVVLTPVPIIVAFVPTIVIVTIVGTTVIVVLTPVPIIVAIRLSKSRIQATQTECATHYACKNGFQGRPPGCGARQGFG